MKDNFDQEAKVHLEKFIKSFIQKERAERWNYFLIEKPEKAGDREMMKFYGHRNEKTTSYIKQGDFSSIFGKNYENVKGMYFDDFDTKAENLSLSEAVEKGSGREAIFSIKAGELALFFTHEYDVFLCQK